MIVLDCRKSQDLKQTKDFLLETKAQLSEKIEAAKLELEAVMPKVPEYGVKKKPAKPYKKNGDLSASGEAWNGVVKLVGAKDVNGNLIAQQIEGSEDLKVLKGYKDPNINSPEQLKDWFFSLGWTPKTFKFVKDREAQQRWVDSGFRKDLKPKPRMVPQINKEERMVKSFVTVL